MMKARTLEEIAQALALIRPGASEYGFERTVREEAARRGKSSPMRTLRWKQF